MGFSDTRLKGEISGVVVDEKEEYLPGATLILTGERLFQRAISTTSDEKGFFRFLNLNPGIYNLEISLEGFNTLKITNIKVNVGEATPIHAVLKEAKLEVEIEVTAEAPLIETKTAQITTNYSTEIVQSLPTERDMLDLLDTTPGINDKGAYGAGAHYDFIYGRGSSTSAVRLNGVDVSHIEVGNTWVNPNYEIIDEVQVLGIGASAEYGNYTGATINIVTKSGTNTYHGSVSAYYQDKNLWGDNSNGIEDLKPEIVDYDADLSGTFGGPLIKEKAFFFLATGYTTNKIMEYGAPDYSYYKQPHFYLKLDWLASKKDTFSFMGNTDPLNHSNKGLTAGAEPETAFTSKLSIFTLYASWLHTFSESSFFELKYAGYTQRYKAIPDEPNLPAFIDFTTGRKYGSYGLNRDWPSARHEFNASFTHYADEFLGASHEFKFGVEYGHAYHHKEAITTGGVMMWAYDYGYFIGITGLVGYDYNFQTTIDQIAAFAQDNVRISDKLTMNIGLRFDSPRLTATDFPGTVTRFKNLSPRFGISYDFNGDAKNVLRFHYGRYYDKMTTYGFGLAVPNGGPPSYDYYMIFVSSEELEAFREDLQNLVATLVQPANLFWSFPVSELIPVEKNLHSSYTDVFNIGFEKELFKGFALSVDYIYKRDRGMIQINTKTKHDYQTYEWTDPYLKKTITVWDQVDRRPDEYYFTNSKWGKRRHHFLIVEFKKRMEGNWSMLASYVFQDSQGNVENDDGAALGLGRWGQDTDPYYTENPLQWGHLRYERPHQFKLLGTFLLPLGFALSADFRLLSGNPWHAQIPLWMTRAYRDAWTYVLLEKRGSRRHPTTEYLNARLSKIFQFYNSKLELILDVLNVFNDDNALWYYTEPYATYPISGKEAFGKPKELQPPIRVRLGIRFSF